MEPRDIPRLGNEDAIRESTLTRSLSNYMSTNILGVSMSTYKEINDITLAAKSGLQIYRSVMSDGKVTKEDLQYLPQFVEFIQLAREAASIGSVFDVSKLTQEERNQIISDVVGTVFVIVEPKVIEGDATYKELQEVFDLFTEGAAIFNSAAEDGKITVADLFGNIGGLISFTGNIPEAVKVGTLHPETLKESEVSRLLTQFFNDIFLVVEAIKKLK